MKFWHCGPIEDLPTAEERMEPGIPYKPSSEGRFFASLNRVIEFSSGIQEWLSSWERTHSDLGSRLEWKVEDDLVRNCERRKDLEQVVTIAGYSYHIWGIILEPVVADSSLGVFLDHVSHTASLLTVLDRQDAVPATVVALWDLSPWP